MPREGTDVAAMASESTWFESGSKVGKTPETVKREHESFKRKVARALKIGKKDVEIASSREELDRQISKIQGGTPLSSALVVQEVESATKAHDGYLRERSQGTKMVASSVQHRLNDFAQFISVFDGLLEKVASAGAPFGEVGYQTLSILLIVIVNKTRNDLRVINHLAEIRKTLPRLDTWREIYPNDIMRQLVADAYHQVIDFSRAAAEYFTRFWHRVYLAINPLASVTFEDSAIGLYRTLAEINAEAMLGLHDTSRTIKQTVQSLEEEARKADLDRKRLLAENQEAAKAHEKLLEQNEQANRDRQKLLLQNEELRSQIKELKEKAELREEQKDLKRLNSFQRLLGVDPDVLGTNVSSVKRILMEVFPNDLYFSSLISHTAYLQLHESYFKELSQYQNWLDNPQSSLLFLSGCTAPGGRKFKYYTHSWLSPAAIYIAEGLAEQDAKVAFFSCHPDLESTHVTGDVVLSSLILQVVRWRPEILRDKETQFRQTFESTHHRTREHMLVDLLGEVLLELRDLGTIYLVIDRLDCCQSRIDNIGNELARLITVLGSPDFRVKIAIVAETSGGQGNWHWGFLPERDYATERLYIVEDWNQRLLTTRETSEPRRPSIWSVPSSQSAATV